MRSLARVALAVVPLVVASPAESERYLGDWRLWPSPFEGSEGVDQSQTEASRGNSVLVKRHKSVGQVFLPTRSPLLRIEVRAHNRYDDRPGRVRLFRWQGGLDRTLREAPLFEDVFELSGEIGYQYRSVFPRLAVEPGVALYLEFSAPDRGEYGLEAATSRKDHYRPGHLEPQKPPHKPSWDLWFRTYSGPESTPTPLAPDATRLKRTGSSEEAWDTPAAAGAGPLHLRYLARFRAHVENKRRKRGPSCTDSLHETAEAEGVLYRLTCGQGRCDEAAVESLRQTFESAAATRTCEARVRVKDRCLETCGEEPDLRFWWLKPPVLAYLWTRESASYTDEDHRRIRELLLDSADRLWRKREFGVHNRSLTLATGYLGLARLYPEHPKAEAWRSYAREVWGEFRSADDTIEDSAQYLTVVSVPSILAYAQLAGEERVLWADPGFLALVDRIADQVAPLGTLPNYGDGSGWARDPGGLIWLLEEAAKHTGQPRYRWLAQRVFDYADTHPRDVRPREDAMQKSLAALGHAALGASPDITPRRPADPHDVLATSQTTDGSFAWRAEPGRPVGQTFVASASPLVRLDLRMERIEGKGSVRVSLWRWRGDRDATASSAPLHREQILAPGGASVSLLPFVPVEVGASYYFEIEPESGVVQVMGTDDDLLPGGSLLLASRPEARADLWFASWTRSGGGSLYTWRKAARSLPKEDWAAPPLRRTHVFSDGRVPDKLVLRSSFEADGFHAVFNLLRGYQHGQEELGALVSLVDGGSVLVSDTPSPHNRHLKLPEDESAPLLRRYWGGRSAAPGTHAEVTHFVDARRATVAWLEWDDPAGWGVRQERRIYFVKDRFLLVRDRFTFPEAMTASAGPAWHFGNVRETHGRNWFDAYQNLPLTNTWKVRNPERYALVFFVPRPARQASAFLESSYLPPPSCRVEPTRGRVAGNCRAGPPYVVTQRWLGEAKRGATLWFDTLLLPHGPETTPDAVAKRVRVLHSDEQDVALEIVNDEERWTVVDRPGKDPIRASDLDTDARYALLRTVPGREPYLFTREATYVERSGLRFEWPDHASVELGAVESGAR